MLSIYDLTEVVAGFAAFFTTIFVLVHRQRHVSARLFVIVSLTALAFWVSYLVFLKGGSLSSVEHGFLSAIIAAVSAAGLLFLFAFARESPYKAIKNWMLPVYAVLTLLVVAAICGFFFRYFHLEQLQQGGHVIVITSLGKYLLAIVFISFAFGLQQLVNTFRASTGRIRRALTLPALAIFFLVSIILVSISMGLLYSHISPIAIQMAAAVAIGVLILVSRFLVFEEHFGQRVVISREAVYSSVGVLLVGAYLVLIGTAVKLLITIGGSPKVFLSVLAAFIVIVLFLALLFSSSIKHRLRGFVDRSIYSGKLDLLAELTSFADDVTAAVDRQEMFNYTVVVLEQKCQLRDITIWLEGDTKGEFHICYPTDVVRQLNLSAIQDWLFRSAKLTLPEQITGTAYNLTEVERDYLKEIEGLFMVPLMARQQLVGFINCRGEVQIGSDVRFLLDSISHQLALSLLSAGQSEKLIETREMASFHKVSSFVIHDIKNLISMLSMVLQNAEKKFADPRFQKMTVDTLLGAKERMKRMINRLTAPRDQLNFEITDCDLKQIILDLSDEMKLPTNRKMTVNTDLPDLPLVRGNREKLKSIISNLFINALEAMPGGGKLTVKTELSNDMVTIAVYDTGVGMTPEFIRDKLFKPFQTGKSGGLGIGLYQSRELTMQLGGQLTVSSQVNKGTCFKLRLRRS